MKKALALTVICVMFTLSIIGVLTVDVAQAFLSAPAAVIYSPVHKGIYTNNSVPLTAVVRILHGSPEIERVLYSLDGKANVTLTNLNRTDNVWFDPNKWGAEFYVTSVLDNLAEGNHTLTIYSQDSEGKEMLSSVEFTIDKHYKYPMAIILSPENKTHATTEVPLIWACDEKILSANYFLDDPLYGAITLSGNTTLTGLTNGTHTITVYALTERGQATSQTIHFTVEPEAHQQAEPFPTTSTIVIFVSVAVVGVGLMVYFKKCQRSKSL